MNELEEIPPRPSEPDYNPNESVIKWQIKQNKYKRALVEWEKKYAEEEKRRLEDKEALEKKLNSVAPWRHDIVKKEQQVQKEEEKKRMEEQERIAKLPHWRREKIERESKDLGC